jgi:hypothetical protein
MTSSLRVAFSILGLATLAGCSSNNSGASDFIAQYCDIVAPCCAKAGLRSDGSSCRAFLGAAVGSSAYDSAKGDACLREMRAASSKPDFCDMSGTDTPSCNGAFQGGSSGTKKPGEPCDKDSDCAPSTQGKVDCASTYASGGAKTSVCQLQITGKEGDTPCGGTIDGNTTYFSGTTSTGAPPAQVYMCNVKDGLYCKSSFTTGAPPPVCTRISDIGGPCETSTQYACVKTAWCDFTDKTCKAKLAVGESCNSSASCAAGGYCDNTTGGTNKCVAQLAEGSACSTSSQCLSNNCNNKKCAPGSTSNLGLAFICGSN